MLCMNKTVCHKTVLNIFYIKNKPRNRGILPTEPSTS